MTQHIGIYRGLFARYYTECRSTIDVTCGELRSLPSP